MQSHMQRRLHPKIVVGNSPAILRHDHAWPTYRSARGSAWIFEASSFQQSCASVGSVILGGEKERERARASKRAREHERSAHGHATRRMCVFSLFFFFWASER